uniref:Uncharacterized protein n=1 Tax=Arundo donax TaxID=35708 RepID=A0A0A8YXV9_ARUDO
MVHFLGFLEKTHSLGRKNFCCIIQFPYWTFQCSLKNRDLFNTNTLGPFLQLSSHQIFNFLGLF